MFLLHFLLLLVPLVLFHEFGHFMVARWMGVRVLSFSIGFGPTVLRWVRGGTEYAVRLLPLGGFVRMLGDDPSAPVDQEISQDPEAFTSKPVWRRALIVAAGPVANFVLPLFILFFGALAFDSRVVSSRLGTVMPEGPAAQAGLKTGDRVLSVAGQAVLTFEDLRRAIAARPGLPTRIDYEREGHRQSLTLTPAAHRQVRLAELGLVDTVGRIEVRPDAQTSVLAVAPGSAAWRAGLRSGDQIMAVNGARTVRLYELDRVLARAIATGQSLTLSVAKMRRAAPVIRPLLQSAFDHQHDKKTVDIHLDLGNARSAEALGLTPAQLVVGPVEKGSPADVQTGLTPGDEILAVDAVPARSFMHLFDVLSQPYDDVRSDPASQGMPVEELVARMRKALGRPHMLTVRHAFQEDERQRLGDVLAGTRKAETLLEKAVLAAPEGPAVLTNGYIDRIAPLTLNVSVGKDERPSLLFGASGVVDYEDPEIIDNPAILSHAVHQTRDKMTEALEVTVLTVAGLLRGHVPVKEVGGPIFMAQLASRTADLGWRYFFELMVWLSVNLAILNLLPIPLVDGGHLLFLAIEGIKRQPVSLRTRQIAAYVGMSFLGLLFVVVMKNDVQRLIASLTD